MINSNKSNIGRSFFLWLSIVSMLVFGLNTFAANRRGLFIQESKSISVSKYEITGFAVSSSKNLVAIVTEDFTLKTYDGSTLTEVTSFSGIDNQVSALSFAPGGQVLIAGTVDGKITTWNAANGTMLKTFNPYSNGIVGMDMMKEGQFLTVSSNGDIKICDWAAGEKVSSITTFKENITSSTLHPNGRWSAVGTSEGKIHIYDIVTEKEIKLVDNFMTGQVTALVFSPDSRFLISGGSDGAVRVWDVGRWTPRSSFTGQRGDITSLVMDTKNRWLVSAAKDSTLKFYNVFTGDVLKSTSASNGYYVFSSFLNDHTLCASTSQGFIKTLIVLESPPDSIPPSIIIDRPQIDVTTSAAKIYGKEFTLQGAAYDDSMVTKVTIDGNTAQLFDLDPSDTLRFPPNVKAKGFKGTVKIDAQGFSQVEVTAYDEVDNSTPVNLSVQSISSDQTIEVVSPSDTGEFVKSYVRLQFKLWLEANSYSISNNLIEIVSNKIVRGKLPGDILTEEIPLVIGFNNLKITTIGKSGERITKNVGVTRRPPVATFAAGAGNIKKPQERGLGMQRWAVVVGISKYQNSGISQLNYADADAKSFAEFLQTPEGGGFESDHMQVLLNQDATYANIKNALYNFLSFAIDSDLVIIYFAGHGAPNPLKPDQLYLLTHDTDPTPSGIRTTAFPMWDMNTVLERYINAKKVIVFTDACHSGGISSSVGTRGLAADKSNPINQYLSQLAKTKDGTVVFTASSANEVSQENAEFGHGVFTYYMLEGLRGKADVNNDYTVTINELMMYTEESVKRYTKGFQNPTRGQTNYDKSLPMAIINH